jgi:hypothetical protein
MKKLCFFISLLLTLNVYSQYEAINNGDSISWTIAHETFYGGFLNDLYLADTITFNDTLYNKVFIENNIPFNGLVGYFREDSVLGKAWFWGLNDTSEYLIMDLGLAIGDSIYVKMEPYGYQYAFITDIEYVCGRKTLTTDYHYGGGIIYEFLTFIEGVGPNASLLYQVDTDFSQEIDYQFGFMVCKKYHDFDMVYAWDTVNYGCFSTDIEDKYYSESKEKINQKVNDRTLYFECNISIDKVFLYDINGKALINRKVNKKAGYINLNDFQTGVYLIKYLFGNIIETKKIIIQ